MLKKLDVIKIVFQKEADENDQLYGSVSTKEIQSYLLEKDIDIKVDDILITTGYKMKTDRRLVGEFKNGKPKYKNFRVVDDNNPKLKKKTILQGNRIEHIDYITKEELDLDYEFYITNQIMNPVKQVLDLKMDPNETEKLFSK